MTFCAITRGLPRTLSLSGAALLLALLTGCSQPPPPPPPDTSVTSPALGIKLAALPEGLTVQRNDDEGLVLASVDPADSTQIKITVWDPEQGTNLVAAVQQHQEHIQQLEQGVYAGKTELGGSAGTAFLSRGRYQRSDGGIEEETLLFCLAPSGDRILQMYSAYPAGADSSAHAQTMLDLLAELE